MFLFISENKPYINPDESVSAISTLFWPIIISPIFSLVKYEYAIVVFYLLSISIYSLTICLICNYEKAINDQSEYSLARSLAKSDLGGHRAKP